jgi:hypothetical protein
VENDVEFYEILEYLGRRWVRGKGTRANNVSSWWTNIVAVPLSFATIGISIKHHLKREYVLD